MAALTLSESYGDRAVILLASITGMLPRLAITCRATAKLALTIGGTTVSEMPAVARALAIEGERLVGVAWWATAAGAQPCALPSP